MSSFISAWSLSFADRANCVRLWISFGAHECVCSMLYMRLNCGKRPPGKKDDDNSGDESSDKNKNEILKMHRKGNKFWLWHHHDTRNSCPTNFNTLPAYKYICVDYMYAKTDNNLIRRLHNFPHFFFVLFFFRFFNWILRNQKRKSTMREHRTQYWELMSVCFFARAKI